jgi:DNA replication protein DnaC
MRKPRTNRAELRGEISTLLRRVAFSQTAIRLCEAEGVALHEQFLLRILKSEIANREEVRRSRFLHEAAFPVYKTLDGFDFTSLKLPPTLSREEICSGAFIAQKKNLVLYGPVDTGKTHLATALGVLAW